MRDYVIANWFFTFQISAIITEQANYDSTIYYFICDYIHVQNNNLIINFDNWHHGISERTVILVFKKDIKHLMKNNLK